MRPAIGVTHPASPRGVAQVLQMDCLMKNKVSISKIRFVIGDKELELTPDEAIELKKLLNETLGNDKTVVIPSAPIVIERERWPYHPYRTYPVWRYEPPIWTSDGTVPVTNTSSVTYRLESAG